MTTIPEPLRCQVEERAKHYRYKDTDLGSCDPETGVFSFLFNPRTQKWSDHFCLQDGQINGITPEGRTTVYLLKLNSHERIAERQRLNLES